MRAELSQRGLRSVYLSESDSVYAQPVAVHLLAIVQACAQPLNDSRVRQALATPLLAQPLAELVRVVTYFKAKGLQYPLVFIPFASYIAQE